MDTLVLISFLIVILTLPLIVYFIIVLSKQGDERQKFIKDKTIIQTFYSTVFMLVLESTKMLYLDFIKRTGYGNINPIGILAGISVIFLVLLVRNKKKYGD